MSNYEKNGGVHIPPEPSTDGGAGATNYSTLNAGKAPTDRKSIKALVVLGVIIAIVTVALICVFA